MVIRLKPPKPSLIESIIDNTRAITTGLKEVLSQNRITIRYPREVRWVPERFRGLIVINIKKCIGCLQCVWTCPVNAIQAYRLPNGRLAPGIDFSRCILCHFCVDACPAGALRPTPIHDVAYSDPSQVRLKPEEMVLPPDFESRECEKVIKVEVENGKLRLIELPRDEIKRRVEEIEREIKSALGV